ncbi:MAG TPA: efflux RND transporter periplasmic adaptor subunit [Permianibacter sp.]|nr:efflux RND transporter periplasmic adaptor subunit [Permianibacter sp.]
MKPFSALPAAVAAVLIGLSAALLPGTVHSHGGEEHGDEAAVALPVEVAAARATLQGEFAEAVLAASDEQLMLWLDDSASNAPLQAELQLQLGEQLLSPTAVEPGTYRLALSTPLAHGTHVIVLTVITDAGADLLSGELLIPEHADDAHTHASRWWWALLLVPIAAAVAWRYRGRQLGITLLAGSLLLPTLVSREAQAGGDHSDGHSHGDETPAVAVASGEAPRRLPDGSLFVPKSVQRLLNVRTEAITIGEHAISLRLNGQVIADPNGSGLVQAPQTGRLLPVDKRLPSLGRTVKAGDVLALLEPVLNQSERANMTGELARVEASLAAAEKRLQRLSGIRDSVPRRELDQAEVEVAGLRAQRDALQASLHAKLPLRAPISGVISEASVVAGAQIEAGDTVYEIISNDTLAVEAAAYDDRYLRSVQQAVFVHNGKEYPLKLLGVGRKLRDQAVPVQFQVIGNARELATGAIGTVLAQSSDQQRGASVPQSALLRGDDGRPTVLVKIAPEQFKLVAVLSEPLPDNRALVSDGLHDGDRVVISGASLLQQIR